MNYRWVPELSVAEDLARQLRQLAGVQEYQPLTDLRPLLDAGRFELTLADLCAERGGLEALMFPRRQGGFKIRVDPNPPGGWRDHSAALRRQLADSRTRFRAAHEIAHSFFYAHTSRGPERRRRSTAAEEAFCDRLAAALLVPPRSARALPPAASSVLVLHRRYQVSVEVAARALAQAHPHVQLILGYWTGEATDDRRRLRLQWSNVEADRASRILVDPGRDWSEARPSPPRQQVVLVLADPQPSPAASTTSSSASGR